MKESIKETAKEYLYFTKSERIGAIALLLIFITVIYSYRTYANQSPKVDPMLILQQEMASLKLELKQQKQQEERKQYYSTSKTSYPSSYKRKPYKSSKSYPSYKKSRKSYDKRVTTDAYSPTFPSGADRPNGTSRPNKAAKHEPTAQVINQKQRRNPVTPKASGDAASRTSVYDSQRPANRETASAPVDFSKRKKTSYQKPVKRYRKPLIIDINKATTESFQRLYGIGPAYSKRIVKFREALGGFHDIQQVSEVYGFPDSTFQAILPSLDISPVILAKIDINIASKDELANHPYLHWKQAKIIIAYRDMHGSFESKEDLSAIHGLEPEMLQKMTPYLAFNQVVEEPVSEIKADTIN